MFSVYTAQVSFQTHDNSRIPRVSNYAFLEFKYGFHDIEIHWRNSSRMKYLSSIVDRASSGYVVSLDQQQCSAKRLVRENLWNCDVEPTKFCLPGDSWTLLAVSKGASFTPTLSQSDRHNSSPHDSLCFSRYHHPCHPCIAVGHPHLVISDATNSLTQPCSFFKNKQTKCAICGLCALAM